MATRDLASELAEAAAHWNFIEKRLKEAEQVTLDIVTPAINELRYAGRQIVDAWALYARNPQIGSADSDACLSHITVARQYLINADHDITDAVGLWLNIRLSGAIEEFGFKFLKDNIPNFEERDRQLKELQDIVSTSRERRVQRSSEYRRAANELIPDLLKVFSLITMAEEIGLARERKWKFINGACLLLGAIGSIASIVSIAIAWDQVSNFFRNLF